MRRTAAALLAAALTAVLATTLAAPALATPTHDGGSPQAGSTQAGSPQAGSTQGEPAAEPPAELVQAQALLADETAPAEREVTMVLRDLWLARPDMAAAERRAADALLARPTSPGTDTYASYEPGLPTSRTCNERICVTHVSTGKDRSTEAWATQTLATFDSAWTRLVDEMGYRAPAGDGVAGGDSRFDVYLANISAKGFYGYCVPEERVPGQPGRAHSYCVLDNDMSGFSMGPQASLSVTAAHEFFHAIQFNIDAREDQWFMEASATWVEEQVAGDVNDNRQFLKAGQLGSPGTPLDTFSSDLAMYGNWIFVQRISQSLGVDAIRQIWERLDSSVGAPDEYSLQGIRNFLSSRDVRWGRFYARFVESNLVPRRSYVEGRSYRAAPLSARHKLKPGNTVRRLGVRVPHLTAHTVQFRAGSSLGARRRLQVQVSARYGRGATPVARLLVIKRNGRINRVDVPLDRTGAGSRKVSLHRGKVRRVVLVLANASTRYKSCGSGTVWACGGKPVDEGQRFDVVARVI